MVFLPPKDPASPDHYGDQPSGETGFRLDPGQTAVVTTMERITLSAQIGGFGFPPTQISKNAILMTNPGHIDPGFSGDLTFTLINMGRTAFSLKRGDPIVTLLLFRFDDPVQADYSTRQTNPGKKSSMVELLNRLAPDFAAFSERVHHEVDNSVSQRLEEFDTRAVTAEQKFAIAQLWIPAVTGLIGALLAAALTFGIELFDYASNDDVQTLEDRVSSLEALSDKLAKELGEDLRDFAAPMSAFIQGGGGTGYVNAEVLKAKVAQFVAYLEQVYHLNSTIIEIGTLYNSIHDAELKQRCSDLLSAPGNFDRVINQATLVLEDRIRKKSGIDKDLVGTQLVNTVMNADMKKALLRMSESQEEHEGIGHICRGIVLAFRNPTHHDVADRFSREDALKVCAFVDNLLAVVDAAKVTKP
jgi:dCTP deaminase